MDASHKGGFMKNNYGKQLAKHETKKGKLVWLRMAAVASFFALGAAGMFFILNPVNQEDTVMGFVALGLAVILPIALFIIGNKSRSSVTIFEEGVIVNNGNKEHGFHFNEIDGLRDLATSRTFFVSGGLGLVGAIATGLASAAVSGALDAGRRKQRIRDIFIVSNADNYEHASEVSVVNTGGDDLSMIYTDWLIKQKSATKESLASLFLTFGDGLEFSKNTFVHKHRKGDTIIKPEDITKLDFVEGDLSIYGLNESGKEKRLIDIKIGEVLNLDLLLYIYNLSKEQEFAK